MNCWYDWVSIRYISGIIRITICMEEFGVFLVFVDLCIPCFGKTLVWYFMSFVNVLSWVHDGFMWMVDGIFHAMFESKESRFCWGIHVSTKVHGETLEIISSLDSGVHESINPVIEWSSMLFINLFQVFSNDKLIH